LIIFIFIILIIEYDRCDSNVVPVNDYYSTMRPLVGVYNGFLRAFLYNHPHIMYDVDKWFPEHNILKNNWKIIAEEALKAYELNRLVHFSDANNQFDRIAGDNNFGKKTKYHWKDGEDILFDDTYEHYVVNNTNEIRIILFCDVDRKLVEPINSINKWVNSNASIASFNKEINQNGEISKDVNSTESFI